MLPHTLQGELTALARLLSDFNWGEKGREEKGEEKSGLPSPPSLDTYSGMKYTDKKRLLNTETDM